MSEQEFKVRAVSGSSERNKSQINKKEAEIYLVHLLKDNLTDSSMFM